MEHDDKIDVEYCALKMPNESPSFRLKASHLVSELRMPMQPKQPAILQPEPSPPNRQTRICVFCSTTSDIDKAQLAAAQALARILHENHIELIYGGSMTGVGGVMGELAKYMVGLNGRENVHGIISSDTLKFDKSEDAFDRPQQSRGGKSATTNSWVRKPLFSDHKRHRQPGRKTGSEPVAPIPQNAYGRTTVVADLQARKKLICRLISEGGPGSGFVALSGGFDIMDQVMEMVTLRQYGVHTRRICLLNVEGFWDPVLTWMELAIEKRFIREEARNILAVTETADEAIKWLKDG